MNMCSSWLLEADAPPRQGSKIYGALTGVRISDEYPDDVGPVTPPLTRQIYFVTLQQTLQDYF